MWIEDGKYWKDVLSSVKRAIQKKYVQWMLVLALLWWGSYTAHTIMKDKDQNKIEVTSQEDPLAFWNDNESFFVENFKIKN